jgi:hypothetical protein
MRVESTLDQTPPAERLADIFCGNDRLAEGL